MQTVNFNRVFFVFYVFYFATLISNLLGNNRLESAVLDDAEIVTESDESKDVHSVPLYEQSSEKVKNAQAESTSDFQVDHETSESQVEFPKGKKYYEEALTHVTGNFFRNKADMKRGYELLTKAAEFDHTGALEYLAFMYLFGDSAPWNVNKSKEIFLHLAKRGSPKGQTGLGFLYAAGLLTNSSQADGYRYFTGTNVPQSCESALSHYRKVAKQVIDKVTFSGFISSQRIYLSDEMADLNANSQAIIEENMLQYYKFLADKGDRNSQIGLANLYLSGARGIEQNVYLAYHYYLTAATAGSGTALAFLGKMYLDGTPATPADPTTAFQYFSKAADKGNTLGYSGLGHMYYTGRGTEQNFSKAFKYFNLAAEQGSPEGQVYLGTMYYHGWGVTQNLPAALKLFHLASQSGNVVAYYNLGQMHAMGLGVARSCSTAVEFYKNVAERGVWSTMLMDAYLAYQNGLYDQSVVQYLFMAELGYETAQTNAAYILDRGQLIYLSKNSINQRAFLLWKHSAEQGNGFSRVRVGDYHYYGIGTPVNYEEAAANYKTATELQRNPQAMFNLGYMHEKGIGIKQDLHLAKRFYDMALEVSSDAALPVTLALVKLTILFTLEKLQHGEWWRLDFMESTFGSFWDIYIITAIGASIFSAERLWKSVTSVSNIGRRKGRARSVRKAKDLNRGQIIGLGKINTLWPGLNSPITVGQQVLEPKYLPPDAEREQKLLKLREMTRGSRGKLHPLERGWSGSSLKGRKLGPPACIAEQENSDQFKTIVLETKAVRHMTARLGQVKRISLLAVVGNGNGLAASNMAAKRLRYIERFDNHTIYQDFWAECRSTQIFAQRMPEGYGLHCHRALKSICEVVGIKNLYARVEGNSRCYQSLTKAFFTGLLNQETYQQLADRKRLLVVEFPKEKDYFPKVIARPSAESVRRDSEVEKDEVLDVDDLYGEGRYPYKRPKRKPFWINQAGYLHKLWKEHPKRNMDEVRIRLLADGIIAEDTVASKVLRREQEHRLVVEGEIPLPLGIGLSEPILGLLNKFRMLAVVRKQTACLRMCSDLFQPDSLFTPKPRKVKKTRSRSFSLAKGIETEKLIDRIIDQFNSRISESETVFCLFNPGASDLPLKIFEAGAKKIIILESDMEFVSHWQRFARQNNSRIWTYNFDFGRLNELTVKFFRKNHVYPLHGFLEACAINADPQWTATGEQSATNRDPPVVYIGVLPPFHERSIFLCLLANRMTRQNAFAFGPSEMLAFVSAPKYILLSADDVKLPKMTRYRRLHYHLYFDFQHILTEPISTFYPNISVPKKIQYHSQMEKASLDVNSLYLVHMKPKLKLPIKTDNRNDLSVDHVLSGLSFFHRQLTASPKNTTIEEFLSNLLPGVRPYLESFGHDFSQKLESIPMEQILSMYEKIIDWPGYMECGYKDEVDDWLEMIWTSPSKS
ncbi:Protein sel-1 -like protein 1 [Trichinella papuae]|uniref:Protein sel-1-like protein 1 n=1 Tax=Trichinella papuae TaxID=268474 RepID=A0A0V1MX98_9BILA|nr:Protein sel-1 -like protein 1 [Trichinella papuae]